METHTYHQTVLRTAAVWTQLRNQCRQIIVNRLDFRFYKEICDVFAGEMRAGVPL